MSPSPSLVSDAPVRPGDVLADKYRVERILGAGGMGVVVAACNLGLGKPVAIKMMLPSMLGAPQAIERFEREARVVVQLRSEHVAEVLDIGKLTSGAPYIVMELLDGHDFEQLLRERACSAEEAVAYVLQACSALAEAHGLGIVHRDLKPRNLFLTRRPDGTPLVKVLDFGISKWTPPGSEAHSLTRTSDVIGSPNYMAPEQIRSAKDVDARTDIWSLGVILFELLTGRVPFLAEGLPQLCALVLEQDAPLVSSLRVDVPPELVTIVARCLQRRPEDRYQSVGELAGSLRELAGSGPSSSPIAPLPLAPSHVQASSSARPAASSSARVHVSNGTSISWAETLLDGLRSRRRVRRSVFATLSVGALAAASLALSALRVPRGAASAPEASVRLDATQTTVDGPGVVVPSLVTPIETTSSPAASLSSRALQSAPPRPSAEPRASRRTSGGSPFPPSSARAPSASGSASGSALVPARSAALPSDDPLTPADRK